MPPLSLPARMRIARDVASRRFTDTTIVLNLATGYGFSLDAEGSRVWELLEQGRDRPAIHASLLKEYDADSATLANDVDELIGRLIDHRLVEACP